MVEQSSDFADLVESLEPDPWREQNPFSDDIRDCHKTLFDPRPTVQAKGEALNCWLADSQPCMFGQMEAKRNRLAFCLLNENDFERGDDWIRKKIQRERLDWKRRAVAGETHAFLIVAISRRIAVARPGDSLLLLASRLCELYLSCRGPDRVHLDDLALEILQTDYVERRTWRVGVNFFSSQGDGRWWRDHRIPGGIAFSMNSVGHMARKQAELAIARNPAILQRVGDLPRERLVYWALPKAMKTIGPPNEGATRGTWLAERGSFPEDQEPPTFDEREKHIGELARYSENRYRGLYHTDETLPTVYFNEGLWRREDISERDDLWFTYLHQRTDTDYMSMGLGEVIERTEDNATMNDERQENQR